MSALNKKIKEARKRRKINQQELSKLSGVSQPHISNAERGIKDPTLGIAVKLFEALDYRLIAVPKEEIN